MRTVGSRLRYIIENQTDNIKLFCEKNSINYTGLLGVMKDDRRLGINILDQLKEAIPTLDAEWLLYGTERQPIKYDSQTAPSLLAETGESYGQDPFESYVLDILKRPKAQKVLEDSVKQILKTAGFEKK